ncbi:Unknown protein, partial [Striga hermonthica]
RFRRLSLVLFTIFFLLSFIISNREQGLHSDFAIAFWIQSCLSDYHSSSINRKFSIHLIHGYVCF